MYAGSGIAPFFPTSPPPSSPLLLPWHLFLFSLRLPLFAFFSLLWLTLTQHLPPGSLLRHANLWCILGIPGVWWVDLQIDGVRRGSLAKKEGGVVGSAGGKGSARLVNGGYLPGPGTIIAASHTSPLDVLYLAAIFDPIFTQSYANSRKVRPLTIESALLSCFTTTPAPKDGNKSNLPTLTALHRANPSRILVVFPEATTSNSRSILALTPSLLSAAQGTKVFPVSLRYTPNDVVTPLPGWREAAKFAWRLGSRGTHCIRVRISKAKVVGVAGGEGGKGSGSGFERNFFDTLQVEGRSSRGEGEDEGEESLTEVEKKALDAVADDLARLGRVKRVELGVREKAKFVETWEKRRGSRQ